MTTQPRRGFAVPNSVVLMFIRGWQGGTDTQIAAELGVTTEDIHGADFERMGYLMRVAQRVLPPPSLAQRVLPPPSLAPSIAQAIGMTLPERD